MRILRLALALAMLMVVAACASPKRLPVALSPKAVDATAGRIGLMLVLPEKPDTYFPGASCLLCLATANLMHSSLNAYTATLSKAEVLEIKTSLMDVLKDKKLEVIELPDASNLEAFSNLNEPQKSPRDFSALKSRFQIERLMIVHIEQLGFERNFKAYVPQGLPSATVQGQSYIVNLSSNALEWFLPFSVKKVTNKNWDEPPSFPGLTNAYFQAIEAARKTIVTPLQ